MDFSNYYYYCISKHGRRSDNNNNNQSSDIATENNTTNEEPVEEEVKQAKIGEPSTVGDVTFTVNGVEETTEIKSGNEFLENATTSGKFIILDVTVKNGKKEAITIDLISLKLLQMVQNMTLHQMQLSQWLWEMPWTTFS